MEQLSFMEKACGACCGIMAEMGNILAMSYQKINVILFCWVEPGIFLLLLSAFLWGILHLPGAKVFSIVSMAISSILIAATAVLLIMSAVKLYGLIQGGIPDPRSIFNMNEPNPVYAIRFDDTVRDLTVVAKFFHTTYAAVNIIYYVLLLPAGIIMSYIGILRNLARL